MDEFSYLSVLLSVILGLAVTQILKGFRAILLSRARIRIYWPVIAWAALLLLICTQHWWSMFGLRNRHDWTFQQFAMVLLNAVLIYMVAGLVFPDFFGFSRSLSQSLWQACAKWSSSMADCRTQ
jgi:hypothetical protein